MNRTTVRLFRPGIVDYQRAYSWQRDTSAALRDCRGGEHLALLQHSPVYTLGRRAKPEHLLVSSVELQRRGAAVVEVDRGGDVTFHGPGQMVGYPILNLRARRLLAGDYVRSLEQVLIDALALFGITGERVHGRPGVWAGGGKIAAIGVRVQGGVTTHGFALNVSTDLSWFDAIVPCGLPDVTVTSMARLLRRAPELDAVEAAVVRAFASIFQTSMVDAEPRERASALVRSQRSATAAALAFESVLTRNGR